MTQFECDSCRFSGNSMDARIKLGEIYCQKSEGIVKKHLLGKCNFRLPIDISICGLKQQAGEP
jgi:hypothetical protein